MIAKCMNNMPIIDRKCKKEKVTNYERYQRSPISYTAYQFRGLFLQAEVRKYNDFTAEIFINTSMSNMTDRQNNFLSDTS